MQLDLSGLDEAALRRLGPRALPDLLEHLHAPTGDRRRALYALQYQWSPAAEDAVTGLLTSPDAESRRMAAIVLDRQLGRAALAARCAAHVDHPDDGVAGFCFEHAESMLPAQPRMLAALARPALALRAARYVARYRDPLLTPAVSAWLDADNPWLVRAGVVALVQQRARSATARARVLAILGHASAHCREAAAEYCAWYGTVAEQDALAAALARETDVHARAAMQDARAAMARRAAGIAHAPGDEELPPTTPEPHWFYRGERAPEAFVAERLRDAARDARVFAVDASPPAAPVMVLPLARHIVPPTRDTLAVDEDGFGHYTKDDDLAFKELVHVGEDVSWYQDCATVTAIADGRVRAVTALDSWGYLVVVEHRVDLAAVPRLRATALRFASTIEQDVVDAEGALWMCSLYGHLGAQVRVAPGALVRAGDKLGVVGRTFTWENGGYPAHLHAGVHLGPYAQTPSPGAPVDISYAGERYRGTAIGMFGNRVIARIRYRGNPLHEVQRSADWTCGYIARWYWRTGEHGWVGIKDLLRHAVTA